MAVAQKKKDILICEKNSGVLKLLRAFFRKRDDYLPKFTRTEGLALLAQITKRRPDALIIGSPDGLMHIAPLEVVCPIIAIVSASVTEGIRAVMKSGIESYLISPFHEDELECRLKVALQGKGWLTRLYREKKDLQNLIDLLSLFSSTLNPQEVLYFIVKKISEMIDVNRCSIVSIDAGDPGFAYVVSTSENPGITNLKLDLGKYPEIRQVLFLRKPLFIRDALKDPVMKEVRDIIAPIGIRSILVIPVIFRNEIIGTLLLRASRSSSAFTRREITLCTAIANASSNALNNAFLYDRLHKEKTLFERLAITDYLTGVYNIRYFYGRLEEEFSRAERYKIPLSCMMFDIDFFKKINDTYGHRIGDITLREFAQFVKGHMRKSDIFARYGGEEFILLLPQTSAQGAMSEAERIRKAVKEHYFNALREKGKITVSIGMASTPHGDIRSPDDLITCADNALFTAKNRGRNQVAVYPAS